MPINNDHINLAFKEVIGDPGEERLEMRGGEKREERKKRERGESKVT